MFKTFFKLVTVFGLLAVSYQGYVRAFTFMINRLTANRHVDQIPFEYHDSDALLGAREMVRTYLGKDHWASRPDVPLHFNSDRGIYLYAKKIAPPEGEDGVKAEGKRLVFNSPVVILKTQGGRSTKIITSEEARLDFNKRLGFDAKPGGEPLTVKHARLERNVTIRDDRGTPDDRSDDMVVGPLTWIEYDADKLEVQTDSDFLLVDRDLRVTAQGVDIKLRPKSDPNRLSGPATGFEGAESAVLRKNVNMIFGDVGSTGVLPGAVKTKKTADGKASAAAEVDAKLAQDDPSRKTPDREPVPLNIQCDGPMQIDLPNAPIPVKVGPPRPPAPTLVRYNRNVVVRRGKLAELPDQLNCDTLDLTLLPGSKPPAKADAAKPDADKLADAPKAGDDGEKSLFGGLALRRAKASGHAVWLQMPSQGAKVLSIELIHNKDPLTGKNTTHFLGGSRRLMVVKEDVVADGPDKGKVQSVTHVWCADATLLDDGDMDRATLVANGPGLLESRPGPKKGEVVPKATPPDRTAVWQDQLWLRNEIGTDGAVTGKIVVLKGRPRVQDRLQSASLDAAESIAVWLDAKPAAPKAATTLDSREVVPAAYLAADPASTTPQLGTSGMTIRRLLAVKDVHLIMPSRDVRYRENLRVDFEQAKLTGSPPAPGDAPAPRPAPAPAASQDDAPKPPAEQSAAPAPKPAEPLMTAVADTGHVVMIVGPKPPAAPGRAAAPSSSPIPGAADANYQIRDVSMRGGVVLHQDPEPGKKKGTDAVGEVLILRTDAPGKAVFDLYHHDPYSPKTRRLDPETMPRARVETEEMTIEAKVIGVNQATDKAWAYGAGKLTQMTDRGLLTDRSPDAPNPPEGADGAAAADKPKKRAGKTKSEKTKITITWADRMTFEGVTVDPMNRPAAKAVFYDDARAEMEDAVLYAGGSMTTYTDRPIPLAEAGKLTRKPAPASNEEDLPAVAEGEEDKPDLAMIICKGEPNAVDERDKAVAVTRKVDPDRPVLLSLQKLSVQELTYDRRSGEFLSPGPGMVFLYNRENDPTRSKVDAPLDPNAGGSRRTVRPTAYQVGEDDKVAVRNADAAGRRPVAPKSLFPPLILTQIRYNKEMRGRFGTGKQDDVVEQRWAEFYGGVETARCEVPNEGTKLNYDHLPADAYFLTSETLRVITEPPPAGSARNAPGRNFLKAWDNAYVTARDTTLQADVITYDSLNDLVYANALEGRKVQVAQQTGLGQPVSPGTASAVRMNPKTGALDVANPSDIQLIDHHTGKRPKAVKGKEPEPGTRTGLPPKPKEPPKRPKRPVQNQVERKGFTGS